MTAKRRAANTSIGAGLLAAFLASCGGGGAPATVPPGGASMPQAAKTQVTFLIDVPKSAATANKRSAQYISPATTQMMVDILQNGVPVSGYPVTVALTPTSGGCTSTLANTTCQLTVSLAAGNYTATLTTEDGNATPLSSAQSIAFTVTTSPSTVPLTLSGIPHALQIVSGAIAMHGSTSAGFKLYGMAAQPLIVTALDADGNTIVGPGAPAFSASVVSGSGWSAAAPAGTTPNTIAITPPGSNGAGATFSLTATYSDTTCAQPGAVCSTTFTVKNDLQTLFASNLNGGTVTVYAPPYTGVPTTINPGTAPTGMVLDGAGDLFVAGTTKVKEFAPPYTGAAVATINGLSNPEGIVLDGGGNLFVANNAGVTVYEFAPPYTGGPTVINAGSEPGSLALNPAGNLFVANVAGSSVYEYPPPYTSYSTSITNGVSEPYQVLLDGAGNLFVANATGHVTVYAPPYAGAPATISNGTTQPEGIALDLAGNLFVANAGNNSVTAYAPPYTGAPFATVTNGVNISGSYGALAIDGAGNLFVGNGTSITEYAPPYTGAPATISSGVNGPYELLFTP